MVSLRRLIPFGLLIVVAAPSAYVVLKPTNSPAAPIHAGRIRGPEVAVYSGTQNAVEQLDLDVLNSGANFDYFLKTSAPVIMVLTIEAQIDLDRTSLGLLARSGGKVVENVGEWGDQEIYITSPGLIDLNGRARGARTSGASEWRVMTPQILPDCQYGAASYQPSDGSAAMIPQCGDVPIRLSVALEDWEHIVSTTGNGQLENNNQREVTYPNGMGYLDQVDLTIADEVSQRNHQRNVTLSTLGLGLASAIMLEEIYSVSRRKSRQEK